MNQENREIKTFGPQFVIETGTDRIGYAGKSVYFIGGITKDGIRNNMSFHEGKGLARYCTEKEFQVECGIKCPENENSYRTIVHKGNYTVNADKGEIRLKGKTIIIEAADELHLLAANKIQIGYPEPGGTKEVLTNADIVHTVTKGGNIGDLLKSSSLFASFAGSFVPGASIASAAAGMFGGATPGGFSLGSIAQVAATAYGGPVAGALAGQLVGGGGGDLSLGGLAKSAATAYGGPIAGIAAETAVNELTS